MKNNNMVTMTYEDIRKMQEKYIKTTYREYRDVGICCICGAKLPLAFSHDPKPVRPESWYGERENRCCGDCNADCSPSKNEHSLRRHSYPQHSDSTIQKYEL